MARAAVNGTEIAYDIAGEGPPVVLIHGLGLDRSMWWPQIGALTAAHRVIAVDLRGAGESGRLGRGLPVLATQAGDLDALLGRLGVEQAAVCGISYGGLVAQEMALSYPRRVSRIMLCDTFADTRLSDRRKEAELRIGACLAAPMLLAPGLVLPALRRIYARWPHAREAVVDGYRSLRKAETIRMRLAANRVDNTARLPGISCPVRGIVGDGSPQLVELMQRLTQAARAESPEVIADSFDPSNLCQPAAVTAAIEAFVRQPGA